MGSGYIFPLKQMNHDNWLIPFGKYKFTSLKNLPASYLLGIYGNKKHMADYPEMKAYIEENLDNLKGKQEEKKEIPTVTLPCTKYFYMSEEEAKKHLREIRAKGKQAERHILPIRAYQCNICGYWHLTSKPLQP
jgi:hypothetical protein